jgi:hypothetical protein
MCLPDEEIGETPFRGLWLVFSQNLADKIAIFQLNRFKFGELWDRGHR